MSKSNSGWRIGVDVGGTFTDLVVAAGEAPLHVIKVPSVPANPAEGVLRAIRVAAEALGVSTTRLLQDCALFVHGSTIATNTLLEQKGATVGLLTTSGFRDSLETASRHAGQPVGASRSRPEGSGAPAPAPACARAHGRPGQRDCRPRDRGRKGRGEELPRTGRRVGGDLLPAQLRQRGAREGRGRAAAANAGTAMGVGVERHLAPHRRVRAHLDRRRQRLHRAADGDLSHRARRGL